MNACAFSAEAARRALVAAFLAALSVLAAPAPASATTTTVAPVADSWVRSDRPSANYGSAKSIAVDASPAGTSYLRFDVPALDGRLVRATLRLHALTASSASARLHGVQNDAWGERSLTYSNAPPFGGPVSSSGPFSKGGTASLNATALVERAGAVSFAVTTTTSSSKYFSSRESTVRPELVIETESDPPPPPPPPGADPVIAAAGDIACDPADPDYNGGAGTATRCRQQAVSDLMVGRDLAAVLPLGDLQYEKGQLANFQQVFDPSWGRLGSLLRPVPGNHEYGTSGAAGYFDYFNGVGNFTGPAGQRGRGYYSYDVGSWHVVALNSNCWAVGGCGPGSVQEQWLRADLAANPADCTLAYWHHPLYTSDARGGYAETRPFWQALHGAGADVILAGHHHGYERFARQDSQGASDPVGGIRQFVVGTGGKEVNGFGQVAPNSAIRNDTTHGVLELTLGDGGYEWRFVGEAGQGFTDSGTDLCDGSVPDTTPPTAPTGVTGTATADGITLTWKASTDDDGVSEYRVLRDGHQIGTSTRTSYTDASVERGATYTYEVVAADSAGNASPRSEGATVTSLAPGQLAFVAADDATIRSAEPDTVFGARSYLETDGSPVKHFLLKFEVAGVGDRQVQSAKLRLHATNPSSVGGDVRVVEDPTWSEGTVSWNNAPGGGDPPTATVGPVASGRSYEVDVTSLVRGDGPVSLRVTSTSSDGADYAATEGPAGQAPQLVIETAAPSG